MLPLLVVATLAAPPEHELRYDSAIRRAIADVADIYPVPLSLVRAVIRTESAFRPDAVSAVGAIGLMQVMPFNAQRLGLEGPHQLYDPTLNILAGVRLLAVLLRHYQGDVIAALVAYNSGPRSLLELPNNGETPAYVARILRTWRAYQDAEQAAPPSSTAGRRLKHAPEAAIARP